MCYPLSFSLPTHILLAHVAADQFGQDVLLHHSFSQVVAVLRQAAQSESGRLLDAGDHILHQGSQQENHPCQKKKSPGGKKRGKAGDLKRGSYQHFAGILCFAGSMRDLRSFAQTATVTSDTARTL